MGEGGDKRAEGSNLVQTKQSHKQKALQAAGAPPPPLGAAPRKHFAESSTAMRARSLTHTHTHTYTHAHPKLL